MKDKCITIKNKTPDDKPTSRKELLFWLWFTQPDQADVSIFKEGSFYTVKVGSFLHATGVTRISNLTYGQWLDKVNEKKWECGIKKKVV